MYKIFILTIIILFYSWRLLINSSKRVNYLFISAFVFLIPFSYAFLEFPEQIEVRSGAFNKTLSIEMFFLWGMVIVLLKLSNSNKSLNVVRFRLPKFVYLIIVIFFISLININNINVLSTFIFFTRFIALIFLFYFVAKYFSKEDVLTGIYDAFLCLTCLQMILSLCYPILGITKVLDIFQPELITDAMGGRGGRFSAVGIFATTGDFGLFSTTMCCYFYAMSLCKYRTSISTILFLMSISCLILSTSRASFLAVFIAIPLIYISFYKPKKSLFSPLNIIIFFFVIFCSGFLLYEFTSFGDMFQSDNFEDMKEARFIHWFAGYDSFLRHPLLGVGLNTHLEYLRDNLKILSDFYALNPIHNIHIQVIVETGILGFSLWLWFFFSQIKLGQTQFLLQENAISRGFYLFTIGLLFSNYIYGFFGWGSFKEYNLTLFIFIIFLSQVYKHNEDEMKGIKK